MHELTSRNYVGAPLESVTVKVTPSAGAVNLVLDGVSIGNGPVATFPFKQNAGQRSVLAIAFVAPPPFPQTCGVEISTVDGGVDRDLLVATQSLPVPVGVFTFRVGSSQALTMLSPGGEANQ